MKNTVMRFRWLLLLIVMSVGTVLAQEGEAAQSSAGDPGSGLMVGILALGVVVIIGLGLAMNSQESSENDGE